MLLKIRIAYSKLLKSWQPASRAWRPGSPVENLLNSEKVRFTCRPARAVMRFPAPPRFCHDRYGPRPVIRSFDVRRSEAEGPLSGGQGNLVSLIPSLRTSRSHS